MLTLEQRLEAYKAIKQKNELGDTNYVCCDLDNYAKDKGWDITEETNIDWPEFFAQKPDHVGVNESWFFRDKEGNKHTYEQVTQLRIQVLENAIQLNLKAIEHEKENN